MINKPPPFKGLNIRIPIIMPIKGRGFINQGSGLPGSGRILIAIKVFADVAMVEVIDKLGLATPPPPPNYAPTSNTGA